MRYVALQEWRLRHTAVETSAGVVEGTLTAYAEMLFGKPEMNEDQGCRGFVIGDRLSNRPTPRATGPSGRGVYATFQPRAGWFPGGCRLLAGG